MTPGFYVVRRPTRRMTKRTSLIVESRPFTIDSDAANWCDWIKGQHPKDEVFVIQVR